MAQTLQIPNVAIKKVKFLQQEADREGISTERYLKGLIDERIERLKQRRRPTFEEVAKPFRKAYGHLTDAQIDQIVDETRRSHLPKKKLGRKRG